jgi:hypothetical protein
MPANEILQIFDGPAFEELTRCNVISVDKKDCLLVQILDKLAQQRRFSNPTGTIDNDYLSGLNQRPQIL